MSGRSGIEIVRLVALFAALGALAFCSRPRPGPLVAGALLVAAGEAIRVWAAGHLRKTVRLVTSGPYRYTRNPLYLGRLVIFSGIALMAWLPYGLNLAVLAAGWALFFGYYLPRKERIEPARLAQAHGAAYDAYRSSVPAILPRLKPWAGASQAPWGWDNFVRNREGLTLVGLLLLVALFAARAAPR
ncbi:MAG: isoprenylcysteine carboxylmethyltransferase family protein [Acidobacteria bacterium]|nr:isoprenylcysteine carboxylmethyltransferase family protein [Acidobacteriota bacterium]